MVSRLPEMVNKKLFTVVLVALAIVVLVGLRLKFYIQSPDVILLIDRAGAQWIKYDAEFELDAKPSSQTKSEFKYTFNTNKKIDDATIYMQALKIAQVSFDGRTIFFLKDKFDQWKRMHQIKIPFTVEAGFHEIIISVISENSHPAVMAYSEALHVSTGKDWLASEDGKRWRMAVTASQIKEAAISRQFPSSVDALIKILPSLVLVFTVVLIIVLFAPGQKDREKTFYSWMPEPSQVRWVLLLLWAAVSFNNMLKLNFQVGPDIWGHIEYIDYIVAKGSLPLFPEGWQMFHPPLNYILSAPLYALLIKWLDLPSVVKMMGIIPVICGLLQIEIVYRTARLVFTERKDLQIIAIVAGSLIPVHTYVCQYVGNEPLVAFFISLVIFLCISLVVPNPQERTYGYFFLLGFIWGLALLSKMTAILLAPVLVFVVVFHTRLVKKPLKYSLRPIMIIFCVSILIAGWYYLRNYIMLGNPFPGVFDALQVMQWWQDPGYRTLSQLLSFGQALSWPVYAGVTSFWGMFYSTLWLDGLNSGVADFIPWNINFMNAGALLALLPSLFMITAMIAALLNKDIKYRNALIFSMAMIALFLAAMIDMYMACPVYSRTKAGYTLGLLPCYALLIAAGAEPFLRYRITRAVVIALFICWAFAAYSAYFVVRFQ